MDRVFADADTAGLVLRQPAADRAVSLLEAAGRPLGAANAARPAPPGSSAALRLWEATAALREHRGDGHVAALLTHGFDGCEAALWRARPGADDGMRAFRGWDEHEWADARTRLIDRGWMDGDGRHTPDGETVYASVEAATDRAADQVWEALGATETDRLAELLTPLATRAYAELPVDNPIPLPSPSDDADDIA